MHMLLNTLDDIDIILIQEPWIDKIGIARSLTDPQGEKALGTVSNPAWDIFLPISPDPTHPPRVATCIRKRLPNLRYIPRPDIINSPDVLIIDISSDDLTSRFINVYNAGPGAKATAVNALCEANLNPLIPTIVAGDFNLHHPSWSLQDSAAALHPSSAANNLADWLVSNAFTTLNDSSSPTRQGRTNQTDSIIDLTNANLPALADGLVANWACSEDFAFDSDHNALSWTSTLRKLESESPESTPSSFRIDPENKADWKEAYLNAIMARPPPVSYLSPEDVESGANSILQAMSDATAASMPRRSGKAPPKAKWWNDNCDKALRDLKHANTEDRAQFKSRFRAAVKTAKRNWAMDIIQKTKPNEIWNLCHHEPPGPGRSPDDPPPIPTRPFTPFGLEEVSNALAGTSNTSAPGQSGSSYRLIKWALQTTPELLTNLINGCVHQGTHPKAFKVGIIAVVPKPRKADTSNPRAYRPIALLECLGKLVEKLIAQRLTYEAGHGNLIPTNQFGGRDKSSVIDAGLSLTHDIQAAWKNGLSLSFLAIDVKGYFDNVNHDRLVHMLKLLGFAPEIVAWTKSFLADRTVRIRIDDHTGNPTTLAGVGIPQGSPVSPILSSIYTAFILISIKDIPNTDLKAYVDDNGIASVSHSLNVNIDRLELAFNTIVNKLSAIGLSIDADKTELIHFPRTPGDPSAEPHININPPNDRAHSIRPQQVIRWLGIYFDRRLNFKTHIANMATKARSTLAGLKILANSVRGLSIVNARLLYKTVIIPILTFGAPVWHTGRCQKTLIRPLETAQNECLRWILGAFSTSPVDELHHISAILPMHILLEKISDNAALRLRRLPRHSQVLARTPSNWEEHNPDLFVNAPDPSNPKKPNTIIQHLAAKTSPKAERLLPYFTPPWERTHKWGPRLSVNVPEPFGSKRERDQYTKNLCTRLETETRNTNTLIVYTDGSRRRDPSSSHRCSGAGYTILLLGQNIKQGKWGLGRRAGIYDAELLAMAGGMGAAAELARSNPQISLILIVADNQSAVKSLPDKTDHPGQLFSILFRKHADALLTDHPDTRIELTWAPGHRGIPGNEAADTLAKDAVSLKGVIHSTLSWAAEHAKQKTTKAWRSLWNAKPHANLAATAIQLPPSPKLLPFHRDFGGPRHIHTRIIQVILGHGFFGQYYSRFVPSEDPACHCGTANIQTRDHILTECPTFEPFCDAATSTLEDRRP
ncbi:hypothetical protein AX17_007254 [Amanita inopinata Kibby_2008]|nr:hypothetical protein AX17_007254 [Amanita inopinata Kibby_2008]